MNSSIFFDLLLGKDNYESNNLDKKNEPGNQLAGIDFNLLLLKNRNFSIYGQIIGEDESGYLPSRTFFTFGGNYSWDPIKTKIINFEYTDTGSKIENYTYSHGIYKDGYRYYGNPIGSAFDADSKAIIMNYKQSLRNNSTFAVKFTNAALNYNNGNKFFMQDITGDVDIFEINIRKEITENINIAIGIQYLNFIETNSHDKLETYSTIEYVW